MEYLNNSVKRMFNYACKLVGVISWNILFVYSFIEIMIEPYVNKAYSWLSSICPYFKNEKPKKDNIDISKLLGDDSSSNFSDGNINTSLTEPFQIFSNKKIDLINILRDMNIEFNEPSDVKATLHDKDGNEVNVLEVCKNYMDENGNVNISGIIHHLIDNDMRIKDTAGDTSFSDFFKNIPFDFENINIDIHALVKIIDGLVTDIFNVISSIVTHEKISELSTKYAKIINDEIHKTKTKIE